MTAQSNDANSVLVEGIQLTSPIGLVAGNGSFPIEIANFARQNNLSVVAVAHHGETDRRLEALVDHIIWIKVGELGAILKFFAKHRVGQATFAGGIRKVRLFGGVKFDLAAMKMLAKVRSFKDDELLRGIAAEFESAGIVVFSAHHFLKDSVPVSGALTARSLTVAERDDARVGWEAAAVIGSLDIGQSVVVSRGVVVAVEAVEGTDKCIERAGTLAGNGFVIVKRAKPQQDLRLDLPTIGPKTIEEMVAARATALVLEAGKSFIIERQRVIKAAEAAGISIVVVASIEELDPPLIVG